MTDINIIKKPKTEEKVPLWQNIINWTLTTLLIIAILWMIQQKIYCTTNITVTPQEALQWTNSTIKNLTYLNV